MSHQPAEEKEEKKKKTKKSKRSIRPWRMLSTVSGHRAQQQQA